MNIIIGEALEELKKLPSGSHNCCVNSPPYYQLRDYHAGEKEVGREQTLKEYITKLGDIYDEVKRVLTEDGSLWIVIGDSYSTGNGIRNKKCGRPISLMSERGNSKTFKCKSEIPNKSLMLVPQRLEIELVDRGWICRNVIIWHKRNCMPTSASDRFTIDYEHIIFCTKNKKYFFEQQFEPMQTSSILRYNNTFHRREEGGVEYINPLGRNMRSVWELGTAMCRHAHFAVYPAKLVERMLNAGCPKKICPKCGYISKQTYESQKVDCPHIGGTYKSVKDNATYSGNTSHKVKTKATGYDSCDCGVECVPGKVLDCFGGSGTTAVVANKLGLDWTLIELNPAYKDIIELRVEEGK